MADIDVVKRGSRAWIWWIVAIALVLLFVWLLMMGGDAGTQEMGTPVSELMGALAAAHT